VVIAAVVAAVSRTILMKINREINIQMHLIAHIILLIPMPRQAFQGLCTPIIPLILLSWLPLLSRPSITNRNPNFSLSHNPIAAAEVVEAIASTLNPAVDEAEPEVGVGPEVEVVAGRIKVTIRETTAQAIQSIEAAQEIIAEEETAEDAETEIREAKQGIIKQRRS
jgi:hypothetical protein